MSLYFEVFLVAVLIAFILLIIHSYFYYGLKESIVFFGFGFIFGLIREIIYRTFFNNYTFGSMPLKILNVPIAIIFGWMFTFYLAYYFSEKLVKPKDQESDAVRVLMACAIFSSFICFLIETAAIYMEWWEVHFVESHFAASDLLSGWFLTTMLFFSIYFILLGKFKKLKNITLSLMVISLIAIIELAEQILFTNEYILYIVLYLLLITIFTIIHPSLAVFLIPQGILFFIQPTRMLFTNDWRIIIFFIIEFSYLMLILFYSKVFQLDIVTFVKEKREQIEIN